MDTYWRYPDNSRTNGRRPRPSKRYGNVREPAWSGTYLHRRRTLPAAPSRTRGTRSGAGRTGLAPWAPPRVEDGGGQSPGHQKLEELPEPEKLPPLLPYPVVLPPPLAELTLLTPVLKPELKVATEKNWYDGYTVPRMLGS